MPVDLVAHLAQLKPGDIITSTTQDPGSIIIRLGTQSAVSHAMLFLGGAQIIEAVPPSVRQFVVSRALETSRWASAWTLDGLNDRDRQAILDFARAQVGKPYTVSAALQSSVGAAATTGRAWYCSALVAAAYDAAGIALTDRAWGGTNPGDITKRERRNPNLRWVGWVKHPLLPNCDLP